MARFCVQCPPCPHGAVKWECVECKPCPHGEQSWECEACTPRAAKKTRRK
jgi:hypothetical protein|tara:strand:- start:3741 stop:3890 length:150 start_codon:yes stop_codon:yes gene_type:complete